MQKKKYGMRYTQYRGLTQVTKWVKLKFAAMNLKKMAMWKWDNGKGGKNSFYFWLILRTSAEKFTIKIGKDRLNSCNKLLQEFLFNYYFKIEITKNTAKRIYF